MKALTALRPMKAAVYIAARTLSLTVRSAWSYAGKDLDRDNGGEEGPVCWTDGTGMLTAPYSTL